jgi:uncharacterized protein YndB with AHSA1/START domain
MIPDPKLDLVLERVINVPPALVWKAWTEPEHLKKWFCPKPWYVSECEIDLRPGGKFYSLMNGPNGESFGNTGCFLEIVPERKLSWTDALQPGFRPAGPGEGEGPFRMTAIITLEPHGDGGTRYLAVALHTTEEARKQHEEMGFHEGWGKALDQLVEVASSF